jgi:hypothetical protein
VDTYGLAQLAVASHGQPHPHLANRSQARLSPSLIRPTTTGHESHKLVNGGYDKPHQGQPF